jgi:hypothetical protein
VSDVYKILGQETNAGTYSDIYTVPFPDRNLIGGIEVGPRAIANTVQSLVSTIIVCNISASATPNFSIRVQSAADVAALPPVNSDSQNIFKDVTMLANTTRILKLGLTLSPGDRIMVKASVAGQISFTVMGIEVS